MPTLIDLLDQYLFSNAPGLVARAAIQRAWEYTTGNSWDKLYLASLEDALSEELPHLSAYSGPSTKRPGRPELAQVLSADLGEAGATLATLDQSSRAFLTELARAMQSQRLITINNHNLFTDEYRQILLNLFDHAHTRFKSVLTRSEPAYSAALGTATENDPILLASISNYLERQFGVRLETLNKSLPPQPPVRVPGPIADELDSIVQTTASVSYVTSAPESLQEDVPLEPLNEINLPSDAETADAPPPLQAPETYPVAWESTNEFRAPQTGDAIAAGLQVGQSDQSLNNAQKESIETVDSAMSVTETAAQPSRSQNDSWTLPILTDTVADAGGQMLPGAAVAGGIAVTQSGGISETPSEVATTVPDSNSRNMPNRLRVLLATPGDVQTERRLLTELIRELDARARTRFGLELELVSPKATDQEQGPSLVDQADIFVGVVWLQFGGESFVVSDTGERYLAGTRSDFARALEQGSGRAEGWLRTVIYRSIRPPLDLLHMDVAEYSRVQQFFERAGAYAGDDLVRVYADSSELINDARARLDAWIYNYAGDLAGALTEYGNNSAANGQIADALADYNQAISLYRELDRPEQELALWLQVGALQQSTNNTAAAEAFDTALRLARRIEDDPAAARALRSLGALDAANGLWAEALDKYRQAGTYLEPDDQEYRALLTDQVDAHEALGDQARARFEYPPAVQQFQAALAISRALDDSERQASLWNKLGALAAEHGEWNDSLAAYDNALGLTGAGQTGARVAILNEQANAHTQLALKARTAGDLDAAESAYQAALGVNARGSGDRQQRVALFTALGLLAADRGEWERGIDANEQALALLDSPDDIETRRALMSGQARAYSELGAQRAERGELQAASSAYRDALSLYQELDATPEQGVALAHLGAIAAQQQEWAEANAYFTEALPRLEGDANAPLREQSLKYQTTALEKIGDERRARNDWGQAEIAYVQARSNLEQLGLSENAGPLLYRLGVVTAAQSRLPEALAFFQQARTRLGGDANAETRVASLRAQSDALRRFADMYRGAGDFQAAQGHYRQQLELAEELQDDALEADAYHSLGLTAADQGEWDNAVDLYDRALARLQSPDQETARTFVQRHQLVAFEKIGERERAAHQLPQAELAYRSALTLAQTLGEKENEADLLHTLGLLSIEHENWDEALVDLRRALGIYNLLPSAPNKPKVIFAIGRAQRGQKQAHLRDTLQHAETARDAALFVTAVELARELGDSRSAAVASQELGNLASEKADWDKALTHYDEALVNLAGSDDAPRRESILRAQLNARRERSTIAQNNAQWGAADADLFVALDLARELKDSNTQGDLVYRRGQVAAGQSRWNEAIDLYSEALNRFDENNPRRATVERAQAEAYQSLGDTERESQNWPGAEAAYIQSLALRQTLNDKAPQVTLFASLGDVAMRQSRWNDAIIQLNSAQTITTELGQVERASALDAEIQLASQALKRQEQETIERRGDAFRSSRAYALARTEYEGALELAQELDDRTGQAELHAKLGFIATETAALEDALEHYRLAAGLYDAPENAAQRSALVELQAQALQEMGNRAGTNGAWADAFGLYSQAVALLDAPSQENHRHEVVQLQAVTCQNLGDEYVSTRDWPNALDQYRRAAGLYAIVGAAQQGRIVRQRQAQVLTEQAREAQQAGDFASAQLLYAEAIAHLSELQAAGELQQARAEQLVSFRSSGIAAAEAGDLAAARRQYRQALGIAEELNDLPAQADLYHRLGQLSARQSDWATALLGYQSALERIGENSELEPALLADQLTAYKELGTSQRIAGDLDAAETSYVRAYTNAQSLDNASSASELAFLLGTLAADRENWESALGYYDQSLASLAPADAARNEIQPYRAFAYQQIGDTQRANGQFAAAASAYANATNIADEIGDETRQGQLLYRFGLLEAAQGRWEPALDAYARAERRIASSDEETRTLLQRDSTFAAQALKREHLAAQLDHAGAARTNGAWDDAATAYRSALALAVDLNEPEMRDSVRRDLVALYAEKAYALGTDEWWDESRDAYRESLELAQEYGMTDEVARRKDDLRALVAASAANANKLRENQDWDAAQVAYIRTLEYAQEFGDVNSQGTSLLGLGKIAQQQSRWQESKTYYEQARPLLVEVENAAALLTLDTGLARVQDVLDRQAQQAAAVANAEQAQSEERFDDAQEQYRTAFGLAHGLQDSPAAAAIAAALVTASAAKAHSLQAKSDWTGSERAYREALGVAREFEDSSAIEARRSDLVALTQARAENLRTLDSPWETEEAYRHALDVAQEFDDAEASQKIQIAIVELASQQAATARTGAEIESTERAYRRAIQVAQEFNRGDVVRERQQELIALTAAHAESLRNAKSWDESESAYRHALKIAQEFDDGDAVRARQTDLIALATARANELQANQDWQASEDAYRHALALAGEFDDAAEIRARQTDLIALATAHAQALTSANDWEGGEQARRHALELTREFQDMAALRTQQADLVAVATARAQEFQRAGDWAGSEDAFRHALALAQEFDDGEAVRARQSDLINLATARAEELRQTDDWAGSENAYRHALELAQEFDDTNAVRARQSDLVNLATARANASAHRQDWVASEREYRYALALGQEFDDSEAIKASRRDLIALATDRARELQSGGDWEASESAYRHALALAGEFDDAAEVRARQTDLIALATTRAETLRGASDWEGSEQARHHALELAQEFQDVSAIQTQQAELIALATAHANDLRANQDWQASEDAYRHALALATEFNDAAAVEARRADLIALTQTRAEQLRTAETPQESEDAYRHALQVANEFDDAESSRAIKAALVALAGAAAVAFRSSTDREATETSYRHAMEVAQEFDDGQAVQARQSDLIALATAHANELGSKQEWQASEEAYRHALKLATEFNDAEAIRARQADLIALASAHANELGSKQEWQASEEAYRHALALATEFNDATEVRARQTDLIALATAHANELDSNKDWQASEAAYRHALKLATEFNDAEAIRARQTDLIALATARANELGGKQEWEASEEAYRHTLALAGEFDDAPAVRARQTDLIALATTRAETLRGANDWEGSEQARRHALELAQEFQDVSAIQTQQAELIALATARAQELQSADDWAGSESAYRHALKLANEFGDAKAVNARQSDLIALATTRAQELQSSDDWQTTENAYRHALALGHEFGDAEAIRGRQADLIALATARAVDLQSADNWAGSEDAYRHALELAQEFNDVKAIRARQADLIALATAHATELGRANSWQDSQDAYRHALGLAQEFNDAEAIRARQSDLIALATTHAETLRRTDDWTGSEATYRHALKLALEFDDSTAIRARQTDLIQLATDRAIASASREDWVAAEREYRYALGIAQEFNDIEAIKARQHDLVLLADNRAQAQQAGADFHTQESAYREALAVAQEFNDSEAVQAGHARIIALAAAQTALFKEKQDREQATLATQRQLQVAQEFGVLEAQADALYALGENARTANDLPSARNYFLTAAQTYEQAEAHQGTAQAQHALQEVETILGHQARLQTALSNAETARAGGRATEAEQAYRDALVETEALNDVPTRAATLAALAALAFDQGQWQTSLDYYAASGPLYESLEDPGRVAEIAQEQERATRRLRMAQRDDARLRGDQAVQTANLALASYAYQQGLALSQQLDDTASSGAFEMSLGQVATAEQRLDDAARWYDAAGVSFAQAQQDTQRATARTQLLATYTALGDKHSTENSWDLAHSSYERASELAEQIAPAPQQAHLLTRLGIVALQRNELRSAIEYLDRGLAALGADDLTNQRGLILEQRAQVWQELGDSEMDADNLTAAQFAYEHALADARTLQNELGAAQILHSLGLVRGAQGEWASALQAHQESYALLQGTDLPAVELSILTSLAEAKTHVGETNAARQDYQTALGIAQNLSDTQNIAEIEFALGEIALGQEHWQESLTHYDAARPGLVELDDTERLAKIDAQQATAFTRLGEILYGEGQWVESEIAFTRALELDSATGRTDRDGFLFHRRGNAAAAQTRFADAIADYDRASVALADDDLKLRDRTLAQLAFALQQQGKHAAEAGDLQLAETAFTRGLKMAGASGNQEQVADLWYRLGIIYRSQARHDEALSAFRHAYESDRLDGNEILRTVVADALAERLLQRGLSALESGALTEADQELEQALGFAREAENPQLVGSTLEALGNSADAQGDTAAAIDYLAGAGKTFASIEDTERWRLVSQKQASLLRRTAAEQLAANEYADAENLYRRTTLLQQAAGDTSYRAETHLGLGQALLAQARFEEALDEFELADAAFAPGASERSELLDAFATALEAHGAQAIALTDLERAESDLTRAAGYRDELGQRTRAGLDWQQLADIASQKREFANAVRANEQALERLNTPETADVRNAVLQQQAQILSAIGDEQKQTGDYSAASETYRHALAIAQEQGDLEMMAQLRLLLGSLAVAQEHWQEAQTEYTHALDVYDELDQPGAQAETWTSLGDMYRQSTQYDDATKAFERARQLYKQMGDHRREGGMWVRLGHVEGDRAEWDRALDQYQAALHLYNEYGVRSAKPEAYRALERAVRNAKLVAADQAAAQGDAELEAESFVAAEESYREAFALYQEADEPIQQAQMHNQLGVALESQAKQDEALTEYRAALTGFERVGLATAQVSVLGSIGDVERKRQNWNQAEASYRQALALIEPASEPARAAALYNSLGIVREQQGDWESAFEHYREAVTTYEILGLEQPRVQAAANLERARREAQQRAEQEQLARLEEARAEGNLAEAGEILNSLGLLAAEDGRWSSALEYYREAVADFEQLAAESDSEAIWRTAQGTVLNNIGDASQQIGAWTDADYAYSRALRLAHELGDRESEAILLSNLGVAAQAQSQLPRALEFNLRALESFTELGDDAPRAELLERVGDLQIQLDQQTAAEASYRQALALAREANESERVGRLLNHLGLLTERRGAVPEALGYYQEGLTRSIELEQTREQQDLLMRQGALYLRSGRPDDAERAHRAALELAITHADETTQATLHTRLGESAVAKEDWQTAVQEYQAALALSEKFGTPDEQMRAWMRIGEAHTALEQPTQADEAYNSALELAPQVENADVRTLWLARAGIAEKQNRWQDAAEYLENALTVTEPTRDAEAQVNLLLRRGDAAMHAHNWTLADTSINDAMELANSSDLAVLYGWGMNRLGLLSQAQRNWNDALENFQEAIEIFRVNQQPLGEALVLNNIARLKLETNDPNQADLFAQAALAIAQAFGSDREASYSLYTRGLASLETQDLEAATRFLNQAIATDPENWAAQLQLGNALLANDRVTEAIQQAEAGLGQFPDWELGAQTQLTIASLSQDDTRPFKANLKRTRALLRAATDQRNVSQEMLDAVESILRALEGHAESALQDLNAAANKPALPVALEAQRFIKTALWALAKSPRRVKGKQVLVNYFSVPKAPSRKSKRRGATSAKTTDASPTEQDSPRADENPGSLSASGDKSTA